MPRKRKVMTKEELSQVEALSSVLSSEQIADYFGIGRTTFYEIMERQPDVSVRYKRGRAKAIGTVAKGLLQKAQNGDTASSIFYLKTQAGWKEKDEDELNKANETKPLNINFNVSEAVGKVKVTNADT